MPLPFAHLWSGGEAPAEPDLTPSEPPSAPEQPVPVQPAPLPEEEPRPADLPSAAPVIGRVAGVQHGQLKAGLILRPPAIALDGIVAGDYQVAGASMIGVGHLQSGQPRQDAYNFMLGESGRLYVAVADGLGSKPYSQLGAHLFVESVLIAAAGAEADEPTEADATRLLVRASERMEQKVREAYGIDPRTAGCVGAVAVFSERGCVVARIGDVSAFTLRAGVFTEAFPAETGPLNLVTASMPYQAEEDIEVAELLPAAVVVLGTDGLANDLRHSGTLREWLGGQWQVPHLPFGVGETLRYRRQGSHDDRTAVLVWRDDVPADPAGNDPAGEDQG
ncbi:protein phosphatase 2C domain-containing protein [Micromonospora tulbaghiae]|uniref:protein phosphatase 2C domain-containing protein n=1 Tax=Micromonospora tulbaghiae TaxID=479978 RepID=UPI0036590D36